MKIVEGQALLFYKERSTLIFYSAFIDLAGFMCSIFILSKADMHFNLKIIYTSHS